MQFLPSGSAVPGRCVSCGNDVGSCSCPVTFRAFQELAESVGITVGASKLYLFYDAVPTAAQIAAWRSLRNDV